MKEPSVKEMSDEEFEKAVREGKVKILITPFDLDILNKLLPEGFEVVYEEGNYWLWIKGEK